MKFVLVVFITLIFPVDFASSNQEMDLNWQDIANQTNPMNWTDAIDKEVIIRNLLGREPTSEEKIDLIRWPSEDRLIKELGEDILEGK